MKEADILRDILHYRAYNQMSYNESIINARNPEARQLFTQLRDDETRAVEKLQQKVERAETVPKIIARLFTSKPRY